MERQVGIRCGGGRSGGCSGAVVGVVVVVMEEEEEQQQQQQKQQEVVSTKMTLFLQASHALHLTTTLRRYSYLPKRLQSAVSVPAHPSRHSRRLFISRKCKSKL